MIKYYMDAYYVIGWGQERAFQSYMDALTYKIVMSDLYGDEKEN